MVLFIVFVYALGGKHMQGESEAYSFASPARSTQGDTVNSHKSTCRMWPKVARSIVSAQELYR